ncbi:NADPH-dependent methylglyoxal reductase Gre2p [Trichomonascus vanleenenianus]|uniref:NADPH-dependent methylglyoxal reductase Gre2p n=1 Tax=Trichomonascus vanleenenianus TaxID=2268995 RepID=UPI003ECA3222
MAGTVLLTGASGFVGLHLVKALAENAFKVLALVRSEAKGKEVLRVAGSNAKNFTIEQIEDISKDNAYDELLKNHPEITKVLHAASPLQLEKFADKHQELIDVAIRGTINLARSAKQYAPQLDQFVFLSSYLTMDAGGSNEPERVNRIIDETSWNNLTVKDATNLSIAYTVSKTEAEKALWKFVDQEKPSFAVTALEPSIICGSILSVDTNPIRSSVRLLHELVTGSKPISRQQMATVTVDVEDVANVAVYTLNNAKKLNRRRLILVGGPFTGKQVVEYAHEVAPGYKLAKPDSTIDSIKLLNNSLPTINNALTVDLIGGYQFKSPKESVVETIKSFVKYGLLEKK